MCHDGLVCCRRVPLIYPAGRFLVGCGFYVPVTTAESFLSGLSQTQSVEKMDSDYFQIWKTSQKNVKIQKSSLNQAIKEVWNTVLKELLCVGAQMNDGDTAKLHMREQTLLSLLCAVHDLFL